MVITHSRLDSESNLIRTAPLISRRRARISMVRYFTRAPSYAHIFSRAHRTFIKFSRAPRSSPLSHSLLRTSISLKLPRPHAHHSLYIHTYAHRPIENFRAPLVRSSVFSPRARTLFSVLTRAPSYVYQIISRAPHTFIKIAAARSYSLLLFTRGAHTPPLFPTRAPPQRPLNSHARPPLSQIFARARPRVKIFAPPISLWRFYFSRAPRLHIFCLLPPGSRPSPALFRPPEPALTSLG